MPGSPMAPLDSTTLLTAEDLLVLPDPKLPHELWRGVLRLGMPASFPHSAQSAWLLMLLGPHVYENDLGVLCAEGGFVLARGPDTVLCPDVAFISKARLPADARGPSFPELAPDLAIEVLSPSNRPGEMRAKVALYLELGVRAVWVFDGAKREVYVHTRATGTGRGGWEVATTTLAGDESLNGGDVLPGFRRPVVELFRAFRR